MKRDPRNSHHLATLSHDGRFWDAYLELEDNQGKGGPARGRIAFSPAGEAESVPIRTATIFLEASPQDVLARARDFKTHQLVGLLRSCAPDEPGDASPDPASEA